MRNLTVAVLVVASLLASCDDPAPGRPALAAASSAGLGTTASAPASVTVSPTASAAPVASASALVAAPGPDSPFVRYPPSSHDPDSDAVDECTQTGGNYFSCLGAYVDEADPVLKRYLWRIAQGHAAGESGYAHSGPPETDFPHAEVPFNCDPTKPCKAPRDNGGELNDPVSCLARAQTAKAQNQPGVARAAHVLACKCGGKAASFPGYNGTSFICDDKGRPAFIAPTMAKDEGVDIVRCASCEPEGGPAACQREIERLRPKDAELSRYIEVHQVRRCQIHHAVPDGSK